MGGPWDTEAGIKDFNWLENFQHLSFVSFVFLIDYVVPPEALVGSLLSDFFFTFFSKQSVYNLVLLYIVQGNRNDSCPVF